MRFFVQMQILSILFTTNPDENTLYIPQEL
jgi:hypothetical protein